MPLEDYKRKRDFQKTPEPGPEHRPGEGPLTFVIQKHAARRLHYDFRLELDGVLLSWSVPKGPSLNPDDKHLAVMVEDHPLDYASFEGVIPKGEYGAGQVIVWDNGTYSPDEGGALSFHDRAEAEERMRADLASGKLSLTLRGRKLRGSWTLVKTARAERDWLLIKHKDQFVDTTRDVLDEDASVISGVTIDDLKAGAVPRPLQQEPALSAAGLAGAKKAKFPDKVAPMQATLVTDAFSDPAWLFEPKLDGVRAIALLRAGDVRLFSRRGLDATAQYPAVVQELMQLALGDAVLDGEIVAPDEQGRPSFHRLQQRLNLTNAHDIRRAEADVPVLYYLFDLLYFDGHDLRRAPLEQRKALLKHAVAPAGRILLLDHFEEDGETAFEASKAHGLEGVVAKRRDSPYESGKRSRHWLKVKGTNSEDFVVAGYTPGQGSRGTTFGALVLGYYDDGHLVYAGNVGSGFDDRTLDALLPRLESIRTDECPFGERPDVLGEATWVRPELVAEVRFDQWTPDGRLRAPVFLHLRDDKPAIEARRSAVVAVPPPEDAEDAPTPNNASSADAPTDIAGVLAQLGEAKDRCMLSVAGEAVALTNLNKELWPAYEDQPPITKREFIAYLVRAGQYALPHLRDRPVTLVRYPNGIVGKHFYQKHWEQPRPDFVEAVTLFSSHNEGDQEYLLCNNLPTLVWLGQLADLELHAVLARIDPQPDGERLTSDFAGSLQRMEGSLLNHPDFILFDLDPYIYSGKEAKGDEPELNKKGFTKACELALRLKEVLDSLGLASFVKTSGATGLHIYVPIMRHFTYSEVRAACETIGRFLVQGSPKDVTMEWSVDKRTGKIFLDHNQNVRGKTIAAVYSPRAKAWAGVSTPLRWDELGRVYPTELTIRTVPDRLAQTGDLWAHILDAKSDLRGVLG
jgi:bifunctional non-homologous end joining protein LigD